MLFICGVLVMNLMTMERWVDDELQKWLVIHLFELVINNNCNLQTKFEGFEWFCTYMDENLRRVPMTFLLLNEQWTMD